MVSNYTGLLDEGMANTAYYLQRVLMEDHEVLRLYVKKPSIREVSRFNPDIIHYIPGRSLMSFVVTKVLQHFCRRACSVLSLLRPNLNGFAMRVIPLIRPDVILTQSTDTELRLASLGCTTRFLPSGVDLNKFRPAPEDRNRLREKYGLNEEDFIVLHVGHLRRNRGLEIFLKIRKLGCKVIIVTDLSMRIDNYLLSHLIDSGCIVWRSFIPSIEEIYSLSDCYVFPVHAKDGSIEAPLSVMEAMACDLPVITTPFGALPRMFTPGDGLFFVEDKSEIFNALREVRYLNEVRTREKVLPYSWRSIAQKLNNIYAETIRLASSSNDENR